MNLEVVSARPGYFTASIAAIEVMQMIIQAVWHRELHDKTELMQLPHMDNEQVLGYCLEKKKEKERVKSVRRMLERPEADRRCVSPPPHLSRRGKGEKGAGALWPLTPRDHRAYAATVVAVCVPGGVLIRLSVLCYACSTTISTKPCWTPRPKFPSWTLSSARRLVGARLPDRPDGGGEAVVTAPPRLSRHTADPSPRILPNAPAHVHRPRPQSWANRSSTAAMW